MNRVNDLRNYPLWRRGIRAICIYASSVYTSTSSFHTLTLAVHRPEDSDNTTTFLFLRQVEEEEEEEEEEERKKKEEAALCVFGTNTTEVVGPRAVRRRLGATSRFRITSHSPHYLFSNDARTLEDDGRMVPFVIVVYEGTFHVVQLFQPMLQRLPDIVRFAQ